MWGIVCRILIVRIPKVGCGRYGTERFGCSVKRGSHFLCDVKDRFDTPFDETVPITSIFFGAKPDSRDDLNGAVCIRNTGRSKVFIFAVHKRRGDGRKGNNGWTTRSGERIGRKGKCGRKIVGWESDGEFFHIARRLF
jgi:hypothetical protein